MKDKIGIYYYPYPQNKKIKMYIRTKKNDIEFRLRSNDDPKMWTEHGWIPYEAVAQAKVLYHSKNGFDPGQAYDIQLAKMLIRDDA